MKRSYATLFMTDSPDGATTPHQDSHDATSGSALASNLSESERAAALRAGRAPVPTKFIVRASLGLLVAVAFGTLMEHFFGNTGQPSRIQAATTTTPHATVGNGTNSKPSVDAILGLRAIDSAAAPPIALTDQHARPWRLSAQRGHVVVLTFFDQRCHDVCPVLGRELREANTMLDNNKKVTFAIVNTNPQSLSSTAHPAALETPGLGQSANVFFLNGPLNNLDHVWSKYGVQIQVGAHGTIAHNNVLYFITPQGRLSSLALPFANESHAGVFSLSASVIHQFAAGIAKIATSLEHQ